MTSPFSEKPIKMKYTWIGNTKRALFTQVITVFSLYNYFFLYCYRNLTIELNLRKIVISNSCYFLSFPQTLLPKLIDVVNNIINRQLSFGYDVGKGYIIAEEEIIKLIDHMVVDKRIAKDLKQRSERNRLDVVKSLGNCDGLCLTVVFILARFLLK